MTDLEREFEKRLTNNFQGTEIEKIVNGFQGIVEETEEENYFKGSKTKNFRTERKSNRRFAFTLQSGNTPRTIALSHGVADVIRAFGSIKAYTGQKSVIGVPAGTPTSGAGAGYVIEMIGGGFHWLSKDEFSVVYDLPEPLKQMGFDVDAIFGDGVNGNVYHDGGMDFLTIKPKDPRKTLRLFVQYMRQNPSRIWKISFDFNSNLDLLGQEMKQINIDPFTPKTEKIIYLKDAKATNPMVKEQVELLTPDFQLDDRTVTLLTIPANCNVTITYHVGAVASNANKLENIATKLIDKS